MRIFALSDLHVDYDANLKWVHNLSRHDHVDDLLILAGDISHHRSRIDDCLSALRPRFRHLMFVPGNHDLWVLRDPPGTDSLMKFAAVMQTAADCGASTAPLQVGDRLIVPLLGWYDFSFGAPLPEVRQLWTDFRACRWPAGFDEAAITRHFIRLNTLPAAPSSPDDGNRPLHRITVSHFLPRPDLVPAGIPERFRMLTPVLGSTLIEAQIRQIRPTIHIYGHSHINRDLRLDGIRYINNAFGYPQETRIAHRRLLCIDEVST